MFRFPKYLCIFREKLVQFKTIIDHLFHTNSPAGYHLFTTVRFNQSLIIYSPQAGYHGQMWGRTQRQTYLFEQLTFFVKDSNCIWTVCCLCCISQFYECDVTCFSDALPMTSMELSAELRLDFEASPELNQVRSTFIKLWSFLFFFIYNGGRRFARINTG